MNHRYTLRSRSWRHLPSIRPAIPAARAARGHGVSWFLSARRGGPRPGVRKRLTCEIYLPATKLDSNKAGAARVGRGDPRAHRGCRLAGEVLGLRHRRSQSKRVTRIRWRSTARCHAAAGPGGGTGRPLDLREVLASHAPKACAPRALPGHRSGRERLPGLRTLPDSCRGSQVCLF